MQSAEFAIAVFKFVLLIFSLSVHECSHAWMASRLGDQTARMQGRVTLNPIYHIDPVGTLIIPAIIIFGPFIGFTLFSGILIGWAKPTPVISRNFAKIRRDENLVTLAGPASNLLLAVLATVLLLVIHSRSGRAPDRESHSPRHARAGYRLIGSGNRSARHRRRPDQPRSPVLQPAAHSAARRQPAAAATCCPTTPCRPTTAFPSG